MTDPASRLERAQELLEQGRPSQVLPVLGRMPPALRDEGRYLAGEALRAQGFFGEAEAMYLRVTRCRDRALAAEAWLGLASVYRSLGRVPEARRALSLSPRDGRRVLEDALIDRADGK